MRNGEQGVEGLESWRRGKLLLAVAALATTTACYSPDHTEARPAPITQELFTPTPTMPLSPSPSEQASKTPAPERPAPAETEPHPRTKEIKPGERIGKIEVHISGADPGHRVITHELFADPRTDKEIRKRKPVDPNRIKAKLNQGFVWHRNTTKPGNIIEPDEKMSPTVIAGHRLTQITGSRYGSRVLLDIDKIKVGKKDGDLLILTLNDGTVERYKAVSHQEVGVNDAKAQAKIFRTKSKVKKIKMYACDTRDPAGVPTDGRKYTPNTRFIVEFEKVD